MGPWPSEARELELGSDGLVISRDDFGLVTRSHPTTQAMPQHLDCRIRIRGDLERLPFEDPADPSRSVLLEQELRTTCSRFCPVLKLGGPSAGPGGFAVSPVSWRTSRRTRDSSRK